MAKPLGMQVLFVPADGLRTQDICNALAEIQNQLKLGATAGNVKVTGIEHSYADPETSKLICRVKWSFDGDLDS